MLSELSKDKWQIEEKEDLKTYFETLEKTSHVISKSSSCSTNSSDLNTQNEASITEIITIGSPLRASKLVDLNLGRLVANRGKQRSLNDIKQLKDNSDNCCTTTNQLTCNLGIGETIKITRKSILLNAQNSAQVNFNNNANYTSIVPIISNNSIANKTLKRRQLPRQVTNYEKDDNSLDGYEESALIERTRSFEKLKSSNQLKRTETSVTLIDTTMMNINKFNDANNIKLNNQTNCNDESMCFDPSKTCETSSDTCNLLQKSIFDGASKDEILEYLNVARDRVPEVLMAADEVMVIGENELIVVNQLEPDAPATPISIEEFREPIETHHSSSAPLSSLRQTASTCLEREEEVGSSDVTYKDNAKTEKEEANAQQTRHTRAMRYFQQVYNDSSQLYTTTATTTTTTDSDEKEYGDGEVGVDTTSNTMLTSLDAVSVISSSIDTMNFNKSTSLSDDLDSTNSIIKARAMNATTFYGWSTFDNANNVNNTSTDTDGAIATPDPDFALLAECRHSKTLDHSFIESFNSTYEEQTTRSPTNENVISHTMDSKRKQLEMVMASRQKRYPVRNVSSTSSSDATVSSRSPSSTTSTNSSSSTTNNKTSSVRDAIFYNSPSLSCSSPMLALNTMPTATSSSIVNYQITGVNSDLIMSNSQENQYQNQYSSADRTTITSSSYANFNDKRAKNNDHDNLQASTQVERNDSGLGIETFYRNQTDLRNNSLVSPATSNNSPIPIEDLNAPAASTTPSTFNSRDLFSACYQNLTPSLTQDLTEYEVSTTSCHNNKLDVIKETGNWVDSCCVDTTDTKTTPNLRDSFSSASNEQNFVTIKSGESPPSVSLPKPQADFQSNNANIYAISNDYSASINKRNFTNSANYFKCVDCDQSIEQKQQDISSATNKTSEDIELAFIRGRLTSEELDRAYVQAVNCLPLCKICKKKRTERKEIISEFVETELKYGKDLKIIHDEFYRPMQVAGLLNKDQISGVFLNLEELIMANCRLSDRLCLAIDEAIAAGDTNYNTVRIGKLFNESADMLHTFETYCIRQGSSACLLARLAKEKELLRIFLRVSQMENALLRRMNLAAFLMVPVQRVTK